MQIILVQPRRNSYYKAKNIKYVGAFGLSTVCKFNKREQARNFQLLNSNKVRDCASSLAEVYVEK